MRQYFLLADVNEEIRRDLVGLNQVILRVAFGYGYGLRSACYETHFGPIKDVVKKYFSSNEVKELWLGTRRHLESEMILFLATDECVQHYIKGRSIHTIPFSNDHCVINHFVLV